jgi:hypothetical protein
MINFQLIDKKYMIGNTELPISLLMKYPHTIKGNKGKINVNLSVNDSAVKYSTTVHAEKGIGGENKVISEFCVFGGAICARFKGSNVPHWIDCIKNH